MAKAIIGLAGLKNKTNEDSPPKEYPPGEHPLWDYMTVRAIVNGVERIVTIKTVDYESTLPLKPSPSIPPDEQL
jgi:hypothetical protein